MCHNLDLPLVLDSSPALTVPLFLARDPSAPRKIVSASMAQILLAPHRTTLSPTVLLQTGVLVFPHQQLMLNYLNPTATVIANNIAQIARAVVRTAPKANALKFAASLLSNAQHPRARLPTAQKEASAVIVKQRQQQHAPLLPLQAFSISAPEKLIIGRIPSSRLVVVD